MSRFDAREIGSWEQDVASLAGSLVHEVKNPLSTLNISTQLLLEEAGAPTTPREQRAVRRLQVMHGEIARIEQIVSSFLQYVRLNRIDGRPLDLDVLLRRLLADNGDGLERAGIRVHFQEGESLPEILGDEALLRQAFLNLVRNAEQAMPEGGELIVRTAFIEDADPPRVEVEWIDTGVGIPDDRLPQIFHPYVSSKKAGTGLGLPTVLRIVRLHGGSIRVETEIGQGSRFVVELPSSGGGGGTP